MKKVSFTLETVTPLFLGGADPRGRPELRAASVRGALRFWLRALLGGIIGDNDLDALRQAESAVFGSTDTGASPVVVRVWHGSLRTQSFSELAANRAGVCYLYFAARGTRREAERCAIVAESSFKLLLNVRAGVSELDNMALQRAYAALWLLTHLGGLGARSRRGAGSLQATQAPGEPTNLPSLIVRATTPDELQKELADGLRCLRQLVSTTSPGSINTPSAFDVLHPNVCKVWVVNRSFNSWEEALDTIGQVMQQFRCRYPSDYANVKAAVQGRGLNQPVQRAAFGLPIVFYYRSLGGQRGTLEGERHDRRASPLMMRVAKLTNGRCTVVLTLFQAQLLSHGEQLQLQHATVNPPDLTIIHDFLNDLDSKVARRLEVTGW